MESEKQRIGIDMENDDKKNAYDYGIFWIFELNLSK